MKIRPVIFLVFLVVISLACNFVSGTGNIPPTALASQEHSSGGKATVQSATFVSPTLESPTSLPSTKTPLPQPSGNEKKYQTEFPLPADLNSFTDLGNGAINFQTKMRLKDIIAFYRDAFSKAGYKERQSNTSISGTTFSFVFDGHPSGKAIVLQGVDLGNGSINVNIRFDNL